jgi:Ser/Thr protein kinase RdoA (MazF antagonist)
MIKTTITTTITTTIGAMIRTTTVVTTTEREGWVVGSRAMTTLAHTALERYGLRGAGLHQLRQGFVRVFHVVGSNREEFCLRMYDLPADGEHASRPAPPPGRPSLEQLRAQLMWLSALARETSLFVPELVSAVDGSLMAYVSPEGEAQPHERGRQCVLQRWVPGTHKREKLGPTDASLVGSYVAGLHSHAQRYALPDPSMFPRWDWHWAFGESVPLWREGGQFFSAREMAIFEVAARRVHEDLQELGYGKDTFGPIHRDLHLSNILFHARRVGVIDFDLCGLGHYLLDLAVLLNGLRLSVLRSQRPNHFWRIREVFFESYERECSLPQDYRRYLMTFHAVRHVTRLNRELRALSSQPNRHRAGRPDVLRNVVTWLQHNYLENEW